VDVAATLIRRVASLALLLTVVQAGCTAGEVKPFVADLQPPVHIAHRGGAALYPENTLVAFEMAVEVDRAGMLELDVHTTADGVLVVHHDDTVDRTTDGSGPVHSFTLAELRQLDAAYEFTADEGETYPYRGQGVQIPTLQEVLEAFPDVSMSIEAKQIEPPLVAELTAEIEAFQRIDSVMLTSFDDATLEAITDELPEVAVNFGENATRCAVFQHVLQAGWGSCPVGDVLTVSPTSSGIAVITDDLLSSAHARDIPVFAWTIDESAEMEELLAMGVDGIMTDRPDILREVLDAL